MAIPKKYKRFLKRQRNESDVFIQGGRRSRKTWTTFEWLEFLMGLYFIRTGRRPRCIVLTYSNTHLQNTIDDFERLFGVPTINSIGKLGTHAYTKNALWRFIHCDDKEKAQGVYGEFMFVNEAASIPYHILETISVGITQQIYYNFNPTRQFRYMDDRLTGNNLLCTTWRDNPYISERQRHEFELMKTKALRPNANPLDVMNYKIYYLGEFAVAIGAIFRNVERCTENDFREIPAEEAIAIDFGFATSGDPTTCIGVRIYNEKIYIHQYIYERGLTSNKVLSEKLTSCGINHSTPIFGDYGGMGRGRMDELIGMGWNMWDAMKTKIMDGLSQMQAFDSIVITETSDETLNEFYGYQLNDRGKPTGPDHAIDAARYAFTYLNACKK